MLTWKSLHPIPPAIFPLPSAVEEISFRSLIEHRGGKPGFLRVVSPTSLVFADYKGNRQMLSTGNVAVNDRVCLFLMDYPQRTRLKILGHARVEDARQHPELVAQFSTPDVQRIVERVFLIDVVSFDWNCPKYITPRYTVAEIEALVKPLKQRIAQLERNPKPGNWEFDERGYMKFRFASINDLPIKEADRKFRWERKS